MHASREEIMSEKSPKFSKTSTELKEEEVEFEQREHKEEGEITGSDDEDFDSPSVFRVPPNRIDSSPAQEEKEEGEIISSSEDEDYEYLSVFRVEPNRIDSSIAGQLDTASGADKLPLVMKKRFQCREYNDNYDIKEAVHLDFRSSKKTKKMEMLDNVNENFQVNYSSVMKRSKEVQANLDPQFPSFFKLMLRFSQEFWLSIPSHFCKMHMPKHDETICLEDETGETYETSYFAVTMELSSGWRGFCIRHNLLKGDVVVFHLVAFCKFKVYIVRASTLQKVEETTGNSNLDANAKERDLSKPTLIFVLSHL